MPIKLNPVVFGQDGKTRLDKLDLGQVLRAIAFDLEEFGQKGVQGVRISSFAKAFVDKQQRRNDWKQPVVQAGVSQGHLVLVVVDKTDPKREASEVLVEHYVKLKEKLRKSSASVTNIDPGQDRIIANATSNTAAKLKVEANQGNYGEITGNIVLGAHGIPSVAPSGRVLGAALGKRTPEQIFAMLTTDKDPKKRVGQDFGGTLTLSGCFTASGGPEASKRDDPFALKVLTLFRKKGYAKISVVGFPGLKITDSGPGVDSHGTATGQGDFRVRSNRAREAEHNRGEELKDAYSTSLQRYNALVDPFNEVEEERDRLFDELQQAVKDSGRSEADHVATRVGRDQARALRNAERALAKALAVVDRAEAAKDKAKKDLSDSGLDDTIAHLEGRFGLRTVN